MQIGQVDFAGVVDVLGDADLHVVRWSDKDHGRAGRVCLHHPNSNRNVVDVSWTVGKVLLQTCNVSFLLHKDSK